MNGGELIRSFVCISPDDAARAQLAEHLRGLRRFRAFKWVEDQHLHLTLAFLGEVPAQVVSVVDSALSRIGGVRPYRARVAGIGGAPDPAAPRVLWLGMREGARETERLASLVSKAASGAGVELDGRRFRAHMTLARARGGAAPLPDDVRHELERMPEASWTCSSFALMRSELTPKGPIYTRIAQYEL